MTKNRKFVFVLLFLAISASVLTVYLKTSPRASPRSVLLGQLRQLAQFNEAQLGGKPYLIHFWAKWCEPCADEIPHLVEFAKQPGIQEGLMVLAISLDPTLEESKSILPDQGKNLPLNFVLVSDPEQKVATLMGSFQYPETYWVDSQHQIIQKWVGPQKWKKPEVIEYFRSQILSLQK